MSVHNLLPHMQSRNKDEHTLPWTGAEDAYTGPNGTSENTVIRNPCTTCDYTAGYFSWCSWWVHHGDKILRCNQVLWTQEKKTTIISDEDIPTCHGTKLSYMPWYKATQHHLSCSSTAPLHLQPSYHPDKLQCSLSHYMFKAWCLSESNFHTFSCAMKADFWTARGTKSICQLASILSQEMAWVFSTIIMFNRLIGTLYQAQ